MPKASVPDLQFENRCGLAEGYIICGVDEVGRGPLAGPVLAAAAILPQDGLPKNIASRIRDSKQLSVKQRNELFPLLTELCCYAIGEASIAEIATLNILHASMLAMQRAVEGLSLKPDWALIDGNRSPQLACKTMTIIRGDAKSLSIAVAAIIAKVTRDRIMTRLAKEYPGYGWEKNAGYGTAEHMAALETLGVTLWHRPSFAPIMRLKRA